MSEEKVFGPRGGDLEIPSVMSDPAWRRKELNVVVNPDGSTGLHRFGPFHDTATSGTKNEQPWHLMAAYMLNAGRTNSEIALAANVAPQTVSQLRAQRWFQERCAQIANKEGEEILGAIKAEVLDSINTIVQLRDDPDVSARVRLSAAISIVEHGKGKPAQTIISDVTHRNMSPQEEMDEIQTRLHQIRQLRSNEQPDA